MIKEFKGDYHYLSNFSNNKLIYRGIDYPTAEHAYQHAKNYLDSKLEAICTDPESTPGQAKRAGRKTEMTKWFKDNRLIVMEEITRAKYRQNAALTEKLLTTGLQEIQEGNTWNDTFWGICLHSGEGQNHLGKILMKTRTKILSNLFIPNKIRVLHYAQVPCKPFKVDVDNEIEAAKIVHILSHQHLFLFKNKIIPDYANVLLVQMLSEEGKWEDYWNGLAGMEWDEFEQTYLHTIENISSHKT